MAEKRKNTLHPEDYEEPACPFCTEAWEKNSVRSIPAGRVIEKLDEYLNRNDYGSAERHLLYWLEEAGAGNDVRGKLTVYNELMGLCRKLGRKEDAIRYAELALSLIPAASLENTVTSATAMLNAATVRKAFGESEKAVSLYEKARFIYEKHLPAGDTRLAGLYNNMALALADENEFEKAKDLYARALDCLAMTEGNEPDRAITYLNMADLAEKEKGAEEAEEEVQSDLRSARDLLEKETVPHTGYYAFVCEKCAPTFGYYGWFAYADELTKRARRIYEGN